MQSLFEKVKQMGHEQVVFCHDPNSGLNAIDVYKRQIQSDSVVKNACINNSMLGKNVTYSNKPNELSLGDFSTTL